MKKITIIIPCRNEENYIADCLNSVIENDYPKNLLEVLVIDGNSNDSTQKIVREFKNKFDFIHLIINDKKTVPNAMNLGISKSIGDYIIRLDAHAIYPRDYISKLYSWSKKLNADNVGAIWITEVKNKNKKTNSICKVLSNKFGVGNSYFRIGTNDVKEVDTVPFGFYRKDIFQKIGLYDERLERDQDIELNKRLKKNGGKIFLVPDVTSTYYARETFTGIAKNNFLTGYWNILTVFLTKRINSLSVRHFIPLLFLLSLVIPLIISFLNPLLILITVLIFILYILTLFTICIRIIDVNTSIRFLSWSFIVLHFSYGFGSLIGLLRFDKLFLKKIQ